VPGDEVTSFDLQRYTGVPDRLGRIAGDLDAVARELGYLDHHAATRAAGAVAAYARWVRRERARAADRVERIMAIPGFGRLHEWDSGAMARRWHLFPYVRDGQTAFSLTELEAIGAFRTVLEPLLDDVEDGRPIDPDEVDAAVALLAGADDELAACLLNLVGGFGYQQLQLAVFATAGDLEDREAAADLEDRLGQLTAAFAAASRAPGRHRLDDAFLDELLAGTDVDLEVTGAPTPTALDEARASFARLDFGRDVLERLARATGPQGVVAVFERSGAPFAVLTAAMPLLALTEHGPLSAEFAEAAISSTLSLASFLATGALASFGFFALGALVTLVFATADDGGTPRRPTRGGSNPGGPGSGAADLHLDDHGVPVAANGG
jgi:hypothetical protein